MIRLASPKDAAAILAIYAPIVEQTAISFETTPPSLEEMRGRIEAGGDRHPWLAAEADGDFLGYAYAGPHATRGAYAWSVNTSVYVAEGARGRGVGQALYGVLLRVLRAQGYRSAFAGITLPNAASMALHEAVGFEMLGVYRNVGFKLGAWHDVGWWSVDLNPALGDPAAPIALDASMV